MKICVLSDSFSSGWTISLQAIAACLQPLIQLQGQSRYSYYCLSYQIFSGRGLTTVWLWPTKWNSIKLFYQKNTWGLMWKFMLHIDPCIIILNLFQVIVFVMLIIVSSLCWARSPPENFISSFHLELFFFNFCCQGCLCLFFLLCCLEVVAQWNFSLCHAGVISYIWFSLGFFFASSTCFLLQWIRLSASGTCLARPVWKYFPIVTMVSTFH